MSALTPAPGAGDAMTGFGALGAPLLRLEGVHTHIGRYHILYGVDLTVPEGEVTMLLGRNGAGKTTTLRTVLGLWRASQGRVHFAGQDVTRLATPDLARLGIAYVPEDMGIFGPLTVRENLILAARSGPPDAERLRWVFGLFPPLEKFWNLPAGVLSGGQKQMLAIARAIVEPRRLLLIDEPTKGLAPAVVAQLVDVFTQLKAARTTILMVEQNMGLARAIGDRVAVMVDGRIVHDSPLAELAADPAAQERLLGFSLEAAG
jgi:branched-chain amino acid transport system ATP-binding protein